MAPTMTIALDQMTDLHQIKKQCIKLINEIKKENAAKAQHFKDTAGNKTSHFAVTVEDSIIFDANLVTASLGEAGDNTLTDIDGITQGIDIALTHGLQHDFISVGLLVNGVRIAVKENRDAIATEDEINLGHLNLLSLS